MYKSINKRLSKKGNTKVIKLKGNIIIDTNGTKIRLKSGVNKLSLKKFILNIGIEAKLAITEHFIKDLKYFSSSFLLLA